jgi:hypothetical protein
MSESAEIILNAILARHGPVLLDDHRRCEACLRDTQLSRKEIAGLIAVAKSGLPARFLQHYPSGLTPIAIANYAERLSDETGLSLELARSSLQAWASALQVGQQPPLQNGKREDKDQRADPAPSPHNESVPGGAWFRDERRLGWLFAALGLLLVAGQSDRHFPWTIATYAVGSLCVLAGVMLLRRAKWIRWPAFALCLTILIFAFTGSQDPLDQILPAMISSGILAVLAAIGILLWKPHEAPGNNSWGQGQTVAAVVLLVVLWDICAFSVIQDGPLDGLIHGLIVHPRYAWHWLGFPCDLALLWLTWFALTRTGAKLNTIACVSLLCVSAIMTALCIATAHNYGGLNFVPPYVPETIAVMADIGAVVVLIVSRRPDEERSARETARA